MGYLNNSVVTVDAILTDTGRQLLAQNDGQFRITQFALADDEIDYTLYNPTHPSGSAYYEKFNPLLTYGNHIHWPWGTRSNCEIIPEQILKNSDFRKYKFCTSHLRTFKSKVLDQIPFSYLCDENGKMYRCTGDVALMMAALEISNPRIIFIPEVLCIYNRVNPLSEDVTIQDEQARVEREIRLKKKLSRME